MDEILSTLRAAGKRVTAAKRTVADVLLRASSDLTADEVTRRVQELRPDVSPSTVYRILEEFEGLHLVVHAHLARAAAVFHLAGPVHGHLVCDLCGATIEVPARSFDTLSRSLLSHYDFLLDRHHVAISGTCAACRPPRRRAT